MSANSVHLTAFSTRSGIPYLASGKTLTPRPGSLPETLPSGILRFGQSQALPPRKSLSSGRIMSAECAA